MGVSGLQGAGGGGPGQRGSSRGREAGLHENVQEPEDEGKLEAILCQKPTENPQSAAPGGILCAPENGGPSLLDPTPHSGGNSVFQAPGELQGPFQSPAI